MTGRGRARRRPSNRSRLPDRFPPAAAYVADITPVRFDAGADWLLEATFDEGKQSVTKDFRPELPLIVHY